MAAIVDGTLAKAGEDPRVGGAKGVAVGIIANVGRAQDLAVEVAIGGRSLGVEIPSDLRAADQKTSSSEEVGADQ